MPGLTESNFVDYMHCEVALISYYEKRENIKTFLEVLISKLFRSSNTFQKRMKQTVQIINTSF